MSKKEEHFFTQINERVLKAEYAVWGQVPMMASQIESDLEKNPHKYPFKEVTYCNIGDPQKFKQKPITFNREVLACMMNPALLEDRSINMDARHKARYFLDSIDSAGSYTNALGASVVREAVAKYIEKNDQVSRPSVADIIMTQGASQGVNLLLTMLITGQKDGIMIPIPQYPLYSACTTLNGATLVPYYLDEQSGWQLGDQQLQSVYSKAVKDGIRTKALVVINPGNPTGAIFNEKTIKKIISFAVSKKIIIIADEVYRDNIYKENTKFASFRRVLNKMDKNTQEKCQLASLHSVSKGLLGQCGLRGGYLYIHNFSNEVKAQIMKLKSVFLCSNTLGQAMVGLMCDPPIDGVSQSTKQLYLRQRQELFDCLEERARLITKYLNEMKNVKSNQVEGAMYAFPNIKFSPKVIEVSKGKPDLFYCLQVVKNTGIVLVPGSGFGQKEGTYHFRITTLIRPAQKLKEKLEILKEFNDKFHAKYESSKGNP